MPSFKLKSSWVTILQGVEFSIFVLILALALQQCSATALPVIAIPCNKRVNEVYPVTERLCVPKKFRYASLKYYHKPFGLERLFLSLFSAVCWKNMYMDVRKFCQTCDTCLHAKRDFSYKTRPLNTLQIA